MFNSTLKKDTLAIHQKAVNRYNDSHAALISKCNHLHSKRQSAIAQIKIIQDIINSIANSPKEFVTQMGSVEQELLKFHQTEEYAEAALKNEKNSGASIAAGVAAGGAFAALAPSAAMSIATTFGTASTGTAISALSGAAAQKAALAWIGRVTGGIATKATITGAGMASGQAFLALAGPIGWGVSAAATSVSLISLSSKNKKISKGALEEAKQIMMARNELDNTSEKVQTLTQETDVLLQNLTEKTVQIKQYRDIDYSLLRDEERIVLGTAVNNTLALAVLVNKTVE